MNIKHVAIIMDGNRRFARKGSLPIIKGHEVGARKMEEVCIWAKESDIPILTLFAFSSENWKREESEIQNLTKLLSKFLKTKTAVFIEKEIKVKIVGVRDIFSPEIIQNINILEEKTAHFTGFLLIVALNYGSRAEIVSATNSLLKSGVSAVSEEEFCKRLYTNDIPDPDLLIRTGGAFRLSNFLLWQMAYTELYFTQKLWPEFSQEDFKDAVQFFYRQTRNFGA